MATPYPYRETLQYVADRCATLFDVEVVEFGEPLANPEDQIEDFNLEHPEGISPQLIDLSRECDGFELEWSATEEQEKLQLESAGGIIKLQTFDWVYYIWEDELNVEIYENDPDERYQTLAEHLRRFHVVDQFADFADVMVGIYCDASRNPELYIYTGGEGDLPIPLGVDVQGYFELLKLSLGYVYWQTLLEELNEYFSQPAAEPFVVQDGNAQMFVNDMTKLNPDFTLEKFIARYDEVRLRR